MKSMCQLSLEMPRPVFDPDLEDEPQFRVGNSVNDKLKTITGESTNMVGKKCQKICSGLV